MRICTICARGGSKGLVGKNTKTLLGEPLIAWSITQAKQSGLFHAVVVSSDCAEIQHIADQYGADAVIKRPANLSTDEAGKIPAIVHAVEVFEEMAGAVFDTVVDLDVTSPLRTPEDIIAAVRLQEETGCSNVITATPAHRSPEFNMVKLVAGHAQLVIQPKKQLERRQDAPKYYDMNASIYVWKRDKLLADPHLFYPDTSLYVMPKERSVDIDDQMDFDVVEMIMRRRVLN